MSRKSQVFVAMLLSAFGLSAQAEESPRSELTKYSVGMEVLGRSIIYGPVADMLLSEEWGAGVGIAIVSASGEPGSVVPTTALIPIFANYYLASPESSWFLTGGLTLITNPGEMKGQNAVLGSLRFWSFPVFPTLGLGYEIRQSHGFLARFQLLFSAGETLAPSSGFVLGWAL